ncbi:iron/copper transporter Atx1 [Pseudohyphozyma bogoriensis]|nr:iron/copper transporter Atx1 [Pseudohyphozyma bogoriensis]
MSDATYKFNVVMTCSGCSGAVDRVLKKTEGVSSYDISLEKQEVVVNTSVLDFDTVQAKIAKTGKKVVSGEVVTPLVGAKV